MSVDFHVEGEHFDPEAPQDHAVWINLCNANARDLLDWLGIPHQDLCGQIKGTELAAKCQRRLWNEPRNHDPGKITVEEETPGGARVIQCGRDRDYLWARTHWLLSMAERAGERLVLFG